MQLIDNWKAVATSAWSSRLAWLSVLLSAAEMCVPFLDGLLPVSRGTFAGLALLVSAAAGVARLVAQPDTLPTASSTKIKPELADV